MLTEVREIDECDMEKFVTLDSSEGRIAILGGRPWALERDKVSNKLICTMETMQ